ncbi:MAG: hypothetical protein IPF99_31125 [Deltaproteobacteria bacterium]|nr:hypothetical protein [Deltaproteobacteria bacterium]
MSTSQLPWLALVDALLCSGRAVEIDGREEPGAVRAAIRRLVSASSLELPRVRIASASTASEALASWAHAFEGGGERLVRLELGTDGFIVALVPSGEVEALMALAAAAGQVMGLTFAEPGRRADPPAPAMGPAWERLLEGTDKWSRHTDGVLWRLLKNPAALDSIFAARDDAPVEDQPLIDALVELYTASSPTEALASLPLDVALRALRYLHFTTTAAARTKLQVAATLCERIDEATSSAESREVALLAAGLVIWLEDAARQVMALSTASRERLARLADGLLRAMWAGRNPHLQRDDDAYELAKAVGDENTARLIAEEAPRVEGELKSFVARQALEWIARRESHR